MQKILLIIIGIIIISVGVWFAFGMQSDTKQEGPANAAKGEPDITIMRTDRAYEPNEVTIKKGDIVLWTNESDEYHWPASDLHPTHGVYPEFDPLVPLGPGEDWKFQFNEVGTWKFHDHIRANVVGTVTVVE